MEGTGLTEEELRILLGAAQGRSLTNSGDGAGDGICYEKLVFVRLYNLFFIGEAPSLTINLNEHEDGERSNNKVSEFYIKYSWALFICVACCLLSHHSKLESL